MKKSIVFTLYFFLASAFFACKDKKIEEITPFFEVELEELTLNFKSTSGFKLIKVNTNLEFTATSSQSWCIVKVIDKPYSYLEIVVTANDEYDIRTAEIVVVAGKFTPVTIRVEQETDLIPIISVKVTNRQSGNVSINHVEKGISFNIPENESKVGVNVILTLADGVSMASPATAQADYDLTNSVQIELLARGRQLFYTMQAGNYKSLMNKFVTGIWIPPPSHLVGTVDNIRMRFKEVADAGINFVWGNCLAYGYGDRSTETILNVCSELGLMFLMALDIDRSNSAFSADELSRCLNIVNRFKDHPAVVGFSLIDEPSAVIFDRLAVLRREIDAVLPDGKYSIANLFPHPAAPAVIGSPNYETYVGDYMRKVQPKVLSFDHYPLMEDLSAIHDRNFVSNLLFIRSAALNHNVPFWGFIQAIGYQIPEAGYFRREPTKDEYRWLCNAHIVFGAKGFSYFLYAATGAGVNPNGFTNSMLTWTGNTTYLYDYAKDINQELSAFTNVIMPFKQDGFIFTNIDNLTYNLFPSLVRHTSYGNLAGISASPSDSRMISGCFEHNGQRAVYLFNWLKNASTTVSLTFNAATNYQLWGKEGLEKEGAASGLNDIDFLPGEAKFLIFVN